MSDFPRSQEGFGPVVVFPDGCYKYGGLFAACLGPTHTKNNTTDAGMDVANKALFYPFFPSMDFTCRRMGIRNGGTVSGNFDLGIYDAGGSRLSSIGTTVQAGLNVVQSASLTAAVAMKKHKLYFLAVAFDNITGQSRLVSFSGGVPFADFGLMEQAAAFVLPATATIVKALSTTVHLPRLILSERTVL